MNDPDQAVTWLPKVDDDLPDRLSAYEEPADIEGRPAGGFGTGLVSLGFIAAALRRSARLWCTLAVVGLVVGGGYAIASPPPHEATITILLVDDPALQPGTEAPTDMALAQSIPVATAVVRQLNLPETPSAFAGTYTVTATTSGVLTISVKGATSDQAVRIASAVAAQFLKFRAQYEQTQQNQTEAELSAQVSQAQQQLSAIDTQITQVSAEPTSSAQQAQLSGLKTQRTAASTALNTVQQYATSTTASTRTKTQSMIKGSQVLDPAMPAKRSVLKTAVFSALIGLIGGLAVGMIIVIVGAITSDRLRRRDDIAYTFGAPVRLSVGPLHAGRFISRLPLRSAVRDREMARVVEYLRNSVPGSSKGPACLAVVAVDDPHTVARAVVELAVSKAKQHMRIVLADLSAGSHAARLLRAHDPGINSVSLDGERMMVVLPVSDDGAPVGPLRSPTSLQAPTLPDEALVKACAYADVVLSLVTLDPARGGEYVATWATDVVAVVTAGRSNPVRIHAAGEMIRVSGARVGSVVVVGADKSDESLGLTSPSV